MSKIPELPEIVRLEAELNAVGPVKLLRSDRSIVTHEELAPFEMEVLRRTQELSKTREVIELISTSEQAGLSSGLSGDVRLW